MSDVKLDPILVSVKEAAQAMGVSPWTVYQRLDSGVIDCRYEGRRRLVVVESLRRYIADLPTEAPEESA